MRCWYHRCQQPAPVDQGTIEAGPWFDPQIQVNVVNISVVNTMANISKYEISGWKHVYYISIHERIWYVYPRGKVAKPSNNNSRCVWILPKCEFCSSTAGFAHVGAIKYKTYQYSTSWWLLPNWKKVLAKLDNFQIRMTIKIRWNHHLQYVLYTVWSVCACIQLGAYPRHPVAILQSYWSWRSGWVWNP